jgi:hypothetical protein
VNVFLHGEKHQNLPRQMANEVIFERECAALGGPRLARLPG